MLMVHYSQTDNIDDDSLDDDETNDGSMFTHWWWPVDDSEDDYKRCSRRWQEEDWRKMIAEEDPVEINDEDVWCCAKNSYDI